MKSIAIWYKPINNQTALIQDVELHFNFWKIPNGSNEQTKFLDIGIKVSKTTDIELFKLYFPCNVKEEDFKDIVGNFIGKADLVSAVFNETYLVVSNPISKLYAINDKDNNHKFDIYKTSSVDINREENYEGTIFNIKVPQQDKPVYLRFRVKGKFIDSLCSTHKPTNAILETAFSEIEMIDFRVNEIRDLNHDLLTKITTEKILKINKQHFFFICSNEEDVIGSHQPFISCRNLENYRWNDYIGEVNLSNGNYLAYHWKDTDKESSSILIKTKYEKNNWKTIGGYSILALIIAVLIELFSNWLYDCVK